jgi:hypothetical protein
MKLKEHLLEHPKASILYHKALGGFWAQIVKHDVETKEWSNVGAIPNKRVLHVLPRISPTCYEKAAIYWSYDAAEKEFEKEAIIHGQETEDNEDQG